MGTSRPERHNYNTFRRVLQKTPPHEINEVECASHWYIHHGVQVYLFVNLACCFLFYEWNVKIDPSWVSFVKYSYHPSVPTKGKKMEWMKRLYRKTGSKNAQISHKCSKLWDSIGPFVMKPGSVVHLLLQQGYVGNLKILIFWSVALWRKGGKSQIWTFSAAQPAKKWIIKIPA